MMINAGLRASLLLALLLMGGCQAGHRRLTPEQIAVLKQQGFQPKDDDWLLGLSAKLLFDTNADRIRPETLAGIQRTGRALNAVAINRIRVEGHTDSSGADGYNMDLSRRRAAAVAQALGANGWTGRAMEVRGLGKQDPVADNATEAGRAENRRVAVIVPSDQD